MAEADEVSSGAELAPPPSLKDRLGTTLVAVNEFRTAYRKDPDKAEGELQSLVDDLVEDPEVLGPLLDLIDLDTALVFANCQRTKELVAKIEEPRGKKEANRAIAEVTRILHAELPAIFPSEDSRQTADSLKRVLEEAESVPKTAQGIKEFPVSDPKLDLLGGLGVTVQELDQVIRYASVGTIPLALPKGVVGKIKKKFGRNNENDRPDPVLEQAKATLLLLREVEDALLEKSRSQDVAGSASTEGAEATSPVTELNPETNRYGPEFVAGSLNNLTVETAEDAVADHPELVGNIVTAAQNMAEHHQIYNFLKANSLNTAGYEDFDGQIGLELSPPAALDYQLPPDIGELPPEEQREEIIARVKKKVSLSREEVIEGGGFEGSGSFVEFAEEREMDSTVAVMVKALTLASGLNSEDVGKIAVKAAYVGFRGVYSDNARSRQEFEANTNPYGKLFNAAAEFVRTERARIEAEETMGKYSRKDPEYVEAQGKYHRALQNKQTVAKRMAYAIDRLPNKDFLL